MSNIKRVSLTTIESNHEKIKTKRKGSFRISIPLVEEPASREYSHFNYETLYKSALDKKRQKKDTNGALQNGGGLTNGGGLEFDEDGLGGDEDELVKMAKKFEQKYGGTVKKDKYSELGAGYDDEDSFIDNTDAYNDELSEDLLPKHGGYYLNRGSLVLERIPEEVIENEEELCARKIKRTIRVIQSSDEEEGGEEEESSEAEESGRDEDDEDDSEEDEDEEETDNEEEKNEDVNSRIKEKKSTPSEAKLNVHSEENGVHVDNKKSCTDKKTIPNSTQQGTGTPTPGVVPNNTHPTTGTSIMSTIESVVGNVKSHEHGNEVGVIKKKKKRKREREEEEEEEGEEEEEEEKEEEEKEEEQEEEDEEEERLKDLDKEALRKEMKKKMAVKAGKETPVDPADAKIENYRQRKMAERLIPNKYKRLYKIMMDGRKKRVKELNHLKLKRYTLDELKLEQERVDKEKMIGEQESK
uniref:Yemanuclein-alpha n=1 Tax=Cacopsylla melanoneura TaxID=428564 RepID=A0A8D8M9Y6_9HEMI